MKKKMDRKIAQQSNAKNRRSFERPLVALALFTATAMYGEGFRNPPPGAFNLGRAGGRIAQVDDSSAVQQNPANLVDLTNIQAQLSPTVVYISADFRSSSGQSASTENPWKLLPNFFISMPLANDRFAVGLGVTVPYGLGNEWNKNSSAFTQPTGILTYQAPYYSKLTTINFNPSFAMKLGDKISVGVGLDVMWSDLEFKQFLSPFIPNLQAHVEGDGVGFGGNLGITWRATERQRFAVTYRSPITIDYNGTAQFENYPGNPSASFNSQITFPTIVSVGYGFQVSDTVRLESDFEWIQFSQFDTLPINIGSNPANNPLGVPSQKIPENWRDTFTAGFGGDWQFAENWVARAGYQFYQSPVPNSTFSPTIPDADQNVITFGLGWKNGHSSLEFAYGLDFYNERNITNDQNPAFNGRYTFNVHLFSFAYRYSF
ncbi:MAG: outer membrane protein transport protein [Verrucomicrobiales bacterium]|nr:outer membrane protein transport protein [Verrucomicrobiales bacterium]